MPPLKESKPRQVFFFLGGLNFPKPYKAVFPLIIISKVTKIG